MHSAVIALALAADAGGAAIVVAVVAAGLIGTAVIGGVCAKLAFAIVTAMARNRILVCIE